MLTYGIKDYIIGCNATNINNATTGAKRMGESLQVRIETKAKELGKIMAKQSKRSLTVFLSLMVYEEWARRQSLQAVPEVWEADDELDE
jgi:hypothetical protein